MLRYLFSSAVARVTGPAIFIDRDGVINCRRPDDYVLDWSQFVFVPGIRAALKQLASLHLPLIVVSNQAAVGKGLLDPAALEQITARMRQELQEDGTVLTAAYYCPHRKDENCMCRKPKPALLQRAADDFNIEMEQSIFIGDSESDVAAARAAGCQPILFAPEAKDLSESPTWPEDLAIASKSEELFEIAAKCLRGSKILGIRESTPKLPFA